MPGDGFVRKKVDSLVLGERLREARERRRVSRREMAARLRIRETYITWMEEGRYDKLPPDVYVRGFLKSYAYELKLPFSGVLKLYKQERGIQQSLDREQTEPQPMPGPRITITPRGVALGSIMVLIIVVVLYFGYLIFSFATPPSLAVLKPESDTTISSTSLVLAGTTDPEAELTINGQLVYVDDMGRFRERLTLQSGANTLKVIARNKLDQEAVIERTVIVSTDKSASKEETSSPEEPTETAEISGVKIEVTIKDNATWLSIESDGKEVFQGTMLPGSSQIFTANEKITLTSGNAGSTRVIFNNLDLELLGEPGEVVRDLSFTPGLSVEEILNR